MNYGWASLDPSDQALSLLPEDERNRYCIQLYHRVAGAIDLSGMDVLEGDLFLLPHTARRGQGVLGLSCKSEGGSKGDEPRVVLCVRAPASRLIKAVHAGVS